MPGNDVRSVMMALRIIDEVAMHQPIGVSDLARRLDLPKSSVQRALQTLHSAGWIQPAAAETTQWSLTHHMFVVGQRAAGDLGLRSVAVPVMEELRALSQETVHLAVAEGDSVIVIERLESPRPVRTNVHLGMAVPIAASANGKAILATRSAEQIDALIKQGLTAYTAKTITDEERFRDEIATIRRRGYATNDEEWREDVSAVSAAIVSGNDTVGAISISTPAHRLTRRLQSSYGTAVRAAAERIAEALSGDTPGGRRDL
jgi:IclR family acetate operon transcriptional repressor